MMLLKDNIIKTLDNTSSEYEFVSKHYDWFRNKIKKQTGNKITYTLVNNMARVFFRRIYKDLPDEDKASLDLIFKIFPGISKNHESRFRYDTVRQFIIVKYKVIDMYFA